MKKSKMFSLLILILFLVLVLVILYGCEGYMKIGGNNEGGNTTPNNTNPTNTTNAPQNSLDQLSNTKDNSGNLVVVNDSGSELVLTKDSVPIKRIASGTGDFLVDTQVVSDGSVKLKLFKKEDFTSYPNQPNDDKIYRAWDVILTASKDLRDRRTWRVDKNSEAGKKLSGTLELIYFVGVNTPNVDVYLNGITGAKIASLGGSVQRKTVGLDFETYALAYDYWKSDNTSNSERENLGTTEIENVMGRDVPIYLVLNAANNNVVKQIPYQNVNTNAKITPYGQIKVTNNSSLPIIIWVENKDTTIEKVAYIGNGEIQNMSSIAHGVTTEYILETGSYTFKATDTTGLILLKTFTATILANKTLEWKVENENDNIQPTISVKTPSSTTNVATNTNIVIGFSKPVMIPLAEYAFSLTNSNGDKIDGIFLWSTDNKGMTFKPTSGEIKNSVTYTIKVDGNTVADSWGNVIINEFIKDFTTVASSSSENEENFKRSF